ncbi:hypothetical protein HYT74_02120 [Candidatus Daviesbacteria bacterium]|nr:hypothetical protein [Candidatus Daviesbacteria bacterium]
MIEALPIRILTDEDAPIFGSSFAALGKLARANLPVAPGIVVTAPNLKLKTILERHNFGSKEVFSQSLTLIQKEIRQIPVPQILTQEIGKHKQLLLAGRKIKTVKDLWFSLLDIWLDQIKQRLWSQGFYIGITENLDSQVIIFVKKVESFGIAYFDPLQDDVQIHIKMGQVHPNDLKKIVSVVQIANKKLFIPHEYEWVIDRGVKLVGIKPYTPIYAVTDPVPIVIGSRASPCKAKSAVRVFLDLSSGGFTIEKDIEGVYIASEKIFDLNKPQESFEHLVFRVVESAVTFPDSLIFLKLADKSEGLPAGQAGMGKVRGSLRLLHQKSLFDPLMEVLDFARHKKGLLNVHIVVPFVRGVSELLQIKRELATKKLMRKNSLQIWMEVAIPENMVNLENYLTGGIDGVVLNLNELIAHFNGFDPMEGNLAFYKNEVEGLLKFLEDGIRLLHKSKTPFIAYGSLTLDPKVLEFLVEKGVYGIVAEKYEAHSAHELLHQTEKRLILRRVF